MIGGFFLVIFVTMNSSKKIIVIGGGAAGMLAAWRAASHGANVLLLEKNAKLGIKILISGGGKCNITNGDTVSGMLNRFQKHESRFLKYAFHTLTNNQLLDILREEGVETYTRDDGKVFPVSHNADDVVTALNNLLVRSGAEIRLQSPVKDIVKNEEGTFIVRTNKERLTASSVVVATGGLSYQKTGTTGDGFQWMEKFAHTIVPIRPALAPIILTPPPPSLWQGTPIRDCRLMAVEKENHINEKTREKIRATQEGDVLITHFGISGPATLEISKEAYRILEEGKTVEMCVDFFPELPEESLDKKIRADSIEHPSRSILTFLEQLVPQRLAEYVIVCAKVVMTKKLNQLTKSERKNIVSVLKQCSLGSIQEIPLDRGEVTAGGISLLEVQQTTMESKFHKGLYLCGEILDIAGPVGGYNLQAAFSTGYVAGEHAGITIHPSTEPVN